MKFRLLINGQEHTLEWTGQTDLSGSLDGVPWEAAITIVQPGVYSLLLGGKHFLARVAPGRPVPSSAGTNPEPYRVQINGVWYEIFVQDPRRRSRDRVGLAPEGRQNIPAPMPGKVIRILVSENQSVEAGQGLLVVEAMKMQNEIKSPRSGCVQKVRVREGQTVNAGEVLIVVE